MKKLLMLGCAVCVFVSATASLFAIGYGLYEWTSGYEFKFAAWDGFSVWLLCVSMLIPAGFCYAAAESLD